MIYKHTSWLWINPCKNAPKLTPTHRQAAGQRVGQEDRWNHLHEWRPNSVDGYTSLICSIWNDRNDISLRNIPPNFWCVLMQGLKNLKKYRCRPVSKKYLSHLVLDSRSACGQIHIAMAASQSPRFCGLNRFYQIILPGPCSMELVDWWIVMDCNPAIKGYNCYNWVITGL